MKTALLTLLTLAAPLAFGAQLTVKSDDAKAALQPLPQQTIGVLRDAGLKFQKVGNGVFKIEMKNYHCDNHINGALDTAQPQSGVPTLASRYNSENAQDTTKGRAFREAHGLDQVLTVLQDQADMLFTDCGMGYCGTWAPTITCTVDTKIENFGAGRFACTYTDSI